MRQSSVAIAASTGLSSLRPLTQETYGIEDDINISRDRVIQIVSLRIQSIDQHLLKLRMRQVSVAKSNFKGRRITKLAQHVNLLCPSSFYARFPVICPGVAGRFQIPENNLDDLHSSREEDGTSETMDP
ncbi:hypothetical protein Tco_0057776 [Tanacetum coccineum]